MKIRFAIVFFLTLFFIQTLPLNQTINGKDSTSYNTIGPSSIYAQDILPNLRFGSINVRSWKGTYDIIAFTEYEYFLTLFAENASAKKVRVIAGIEDGKIIYDQTFPFVSDTLPKRIAFSHTLPVGTHTMYIVVDPENTIMESNESDNRITRLFSADLRIRVH